jgi:hypothetical protein
LAGEHPGTVLVRINLGNTHWVSAALSTSDQTAIVYDLMARALSAPKRNTIA